MDIVTHALIGMAASAGVMPTHPELACGLVLGNVAPDLDAFSRLGGKHAFLRFHQTYTHSVAAIALPMLIGACLWMFGSEIWAQFAIGLGLGMVMHVGLDLTNSYGVRCLWPFTSKRFALDWIFFIDAPILILTVLALASIWLAGTQVGALQLISLGFVAMLTLVVALRGMIALRVRRMLRPHNADSLLLASIPTTWSPFRFLVCQENADGVVLFCINALSGRSSHIEAVEVLDRVCPQAITETLEFSVMKSLSPHYHVVEQLSSEGLTTYVCRDLRIRNFDTQFGTLTCRVDQDAQVVSKKWDV